MGYALSWYVPGKVLYLQISRDTALNDFKAVNQEMLDYLNEGEMLHLVIDVTGFDPYLLLPWEYVRASQTYVSHNNLESVLVAPYTRNPLVRLMMLVLFNLSRAELNFFKTFEEVDAFLKRQAIEVVR